MAGDTSKEVRIRTAHDALVSASAAEVYGKVSQDAARRLKERKDDEPENWSSNTGNVAPSDRMYWTEEQ